MTKYLLALVAVMGLGMGAVACGGDDCEKFADAFADKAKECGCEVKENESSDEGEKTECTDELAEQSRKALEELEKTSCEDNPLFAACKAASEE